MPAEDATWTRRLQAAVILLAIARDADTQADGTACWPAAMAALEILGVTGAELARCVDQLTVADSMDMDDAARFLFPYPAP